MLEIAGFICEDWINTCRILMIFETYWFVNQSFKIVQKTKILHGLISYCNIEVTHKYKVIINFAILIKDNKIQVV